MENITDFLLQKMPQIKQIEDTFSPEPALCVYRKRQGQSWH